MVENIFIKTRREAVELGQILMNNGYIYHATHKLPFCDGTQFYCFEVCYPYTFPLPSSLNISLFPAREKNVQEGLP